MSSDDEAETGEGAWWKKRSGGEAKKEGLGLLLSQLVECRSCKPAPCSPGTVMLGGPFRQVFGVSLTANIVSVSPA